MICRKCSFILQGSEKFCPNCGAPSNEKPQNEKEEAVTSPAPPSILFSAPKEEIEVPKNFEPRIFSEENVQEDFHTKKKKNKAPALLIALLVILVIALGGFTVMEYFDLAPAIMQYLETGAVASEEETTKTDSANSDVTEGELPSDYGTVAPDINFKITFCYVSSDKSVALRKGPDDSYALLETIQSGTKLQVLGGSVTNDTWVYAYVPSSDIYGWVSGSFLSEADSFEKTEETTSSVSESTESAETPNNE